MKFTETFMADYVHGIQRCLEVIPLAQVAAVAERLLEAYRQDQVVAIIGNGGSAATASHMACDLGKTILGASHPSDLRRLRVLALTDNVPLITAWANDVAYSTIFAEQLKCWVGEGDVVVAITGSGNSANICEAIKTARELGAYTVGFLGFDGGRVRELLNMPVVVPSDNYGYVEDLHMMFVHMIAAYIRSELAASELAFPLPEVQMTRPALAISSGKGIS